MAKETALSEKSLTSELGNARVYKPTQGRIVRQVTFFALWAIVSLGCWQLQTTLQYVDFGDSLQGLESWLRDWGCFVIPGVLWAVGSWVSFRLVNWPKFADFLIAVEAELNKVTWPSTAELIRASAVVIFTIFFLAISLFLFDVIWRALFEAIGVLR